MSTTLPLASIIIDNYNYGRFLKDAIDSALAQTYRNTEVIVVDDGSTDNSREIMANYGDSIIPVLKENGGQGSAFNRGFAVSKGEVIIFLDSDDMLAATSLEKAVPFFNNRDVVKVHWPLWIVDEQGKPTGQIYPGGSLAEGDLREHVFQLGPTNHLSAPGCGNAWARVFLSQIFPIPELLYHNGCDTYMFETAPFFGSLKTISEPQTFYRQHATNDHRLMELNDKIDRELRFYHHYSSFLVQYCASIGVQADIEKWKRNSWWHRQKRLIETMGNWPDPGTRVILIDDATLETGILPNHVQIPFMAKDNEYWGPPADDDTAIAEMERQRRLGAKYLVLVWPAFWWLDYYRDFHRYLRTNYRLVLNNTDLIAFAL